MRIAVKFKIVTRVRKTGSSEAALRDYLTNTVQPHLVTILNDGTAADFTNRDVQGSMRTWVMAANVYGTYPKVMFRGTTSLTPAECATKLNAIANQMASSISADLVAGGGTVQEQVVKAFGGPVYATETGA